MFCLVYRREEKRYVKGQMTVLKLLLCLLEAGLRAVEGGGCSE